MPAKIGVLNPQLIKAIKNLLDSHGVIDKRSKISSDGLTSTIYTTASPQVIGTYLEEFLADVTIEEFETIEDAAPKQTLHSIVKQFLSSENADLLYKLPKKWSVYPPMVLFGSGTFDSPEWTNYFAEHDLKPLFSRLQAVFPGITHFAVNKPIIEADIMRRPFNLVPLHGDFGSEPTDSLYAHPSQEDLKKAFWCTALQNGIFQTWAPRYTMFSRGNIKEKKRLIDNYTKLDTKVVLDLYAGIGYFTLSYLANGATLFCWEVNPWSIDGLVRGLARNGHKYKLIAENEVLGAKEYKLLVDSGVKAFVYHESNEHAPRRIQDLQTTLPIAHVNLGLLPTLKPSWPIVNRVARFSSSDFSAHVHENVHKNEFEDLTSAVASAMGGQVVHLEKVKTFAPDVWHVVIDTSICVTCT